MAIIIEKAKAEDAEAILNLTKVCGSETDNLSFGESGIPVSAENEAAIHLYRKFGFEKIGTFKGYFKIGEELIDFDIMELFL